MSSSTQEAAKLEILIVGAGPVGVVAATGLARDGHKVTILERHTALQSQGGPVQIQAAACEVLRGLGLGPQLEKFTFVSGGTVFWSYKDANTPLAKVGNSGPKQMHVCDRKTIQQFGYDTAVAAGATILLGKKVISLDESGPRVSVTTADGHTYSGNLLLGTDGVGSVVRSLLFGEAAGAILSPEVIYHSVIPVEAIKADPRCAYMVESGSGAHFTFGPGRLSIIGSGGLGGLPAVGYSAVMNYGSHREGSLYEPCEPAEVQAAFADFGEPDRAALSHVSQCFRWRVALAPALASWRSVSGKTLLLGDAAHAMYPHMGQGVSQGIESAGALVWMLRSATGAHHVPAVLERFEAFRRPRVERFVKLSIENGRTYSMPDGPAQEARDAAMRGLSTTTVQPSVAPDPDPDAPIRSAAFQRWSREYDVATEVSIRP